MRPNISGEKAITIISLFTVFMTFDLFKHAFFDVVNYLSEVAFNLLVILGPLMLVNLVYSHKYGTGSWNFNKKRYINWMYFNHNNLLSQKLFQISILIPFLYFLLFSTLIYIGNGHDVNFSPSSLKSFVSQYSFPLGILSSSLVFMVLIAKAHSTEQTSLQINEMLRKNNIELYYSHKRDFLCYIESKQLEVGNNECLVGDSNAIYNWVYGTGIEKEVKSKLSLGMIIQRISLFADAIERLAESMCVIENGIGGGEQIEIHRSNIHHQLVNIYSFYKDSGIRFKEEKREELQYFDSSYSTDLFNAERIRIFCMFVNSIIRFSLLYEGKTIENEEPIRVKNAIKAIDWVLLDELLMLLEPDSPNIRFV